MTSSLPLPLGSGLSAEAQAPFTGKLCQRPDSTWAGLYRLSRVCAHASVHTGLPGGLIPTAIGMRFLRHHGIYQSDMGL